jgi:phosphoserine aminotransferase
VGNRAHNFNPGPAALPLEVLQEAQEQFVEYQGIGMSIMEISHRSKEYERVNEETQALLRELMGIPSGYRVLFMGGGASTQFALVPMNFLIPGKVASYMVTGSFSEKALQEAQIIGETFVSASGKESKWAHLPEPDDIRLHQDSAYLHMTSNNTIEGSQFKYTPDTGAIPLIADMTSHILSTPVDVSKYALIYAGAQKNLGPAGVTVAIVRDDMLRDEPKSVPTMLRYTTYAANNSLYNTPPVHSIYMMNLVLQWVKRNGGVEAMEKRNIEKSQLLYDVIDASEGFYRGIVETKSRSIMNVTWRMKDEETEKRFVKESIDKGFIHLAGHRSVGGLRASVYNAVPYESCKALSEFMTDFMKRNV